MSFSNFNKVTAKILTVIFRITRDNASSNLTLMTEWTNNYKEKFDIDFIGDIPCAAHVINLIVNDIMSELNLKALKSDEIAIYMEYAEKLSKKKRVGRNTPNLPDTLKKFLKI